MSIEINSLSEYIQNLHSLRSKYFLGYGNHLAELLFRGHADVNYKLLPSLAREPNSVAREWNYVELAKYKLPDVFRDGMSPVELLALLQHYGVPTRLLDVTENALVALYFACCSEPNRDGNVFVFINRDYHMNIPPVANAIADTCSITRGTSYYFLDHFVKNALYRPYFIEQKFVFDSDTIEESGYENWMIGCCETPIFLFSPVRVLRQQLQSGRFLLFSNDIADYAEPGEKGFVDKISPFPKDHKCIVETFVVKAQAKDEILDDLELCGICKATLFADSVDIVCEGITNRVNLT